LLIDALHDFTGGLVEFFNFEEEKPSQEVFTNILFKALERQSLVGCIINSHVSQTLSFLSDLCEFSFHRFNLIAQPQYYPMVSSLAVLIMLLI
jgi:hypothetical protein